MQPEWERLPQIIVSWAEKLGKENACANWSFLFLSAHLTSSLSSLSTLLSAC